MATLSAIEFGNTLKYTLSDGSTVEEAEPWDETFYKNLNYTKTTDDCILVMNVSMSVQCIPTGAAPEPRKQEPETGVEEA